MTQNVKKNYFNVDLYCLNLYTRSLIKNNVIYVIPTIRKTFRIIDSSAVIAIVIFIAVDMWKSVIYLEHRTSLYAAVLFLNCWMHARTSAFRKLFVCHADTMRTRKAQAFQRYTLYGTINGHDQTLQQCR